MKKDITDNYKLAKIRDIHKVLRMLGISEKRKGFSYITDAILFYQNNNNDFDFKVVSKNIAEKRNVKESHVRNMVINAIKDAHDDCINNNLWEYIFYHNSKKNLKLPEDSEFIKKVAIFIDKYDIDWNKFLY